MSFVLIIYLGFNYEWIKKFSAFFHKWSWYVHVFFSESRLSFRAWITDYFLNKDHTENTRVISRLFWYRAYAILRKDESSDKSLWNSADLKIGYQLIIWQGYALKQLRPTNFRGITQQFKECLERFPMTSPTGENAIKNYRLI